MWQEKRLPTNLPFSSSVLPLRPSNIFIAYTTIPWKKCILSSPGFFGRISTINTAQPFRHFGLSCNPCEQWLPVDELRHCSECERVSLRGSGFSSFRRIFDYFLHHQNFAAHDRLTVWHCGVHTLLMHVCSLKRIFTFSGWFFRNVVPEQKSYC